MKINRYDNTLVSQEWLKENLHYDPETGVFTGVWNPKTYNRRNSRVAGKPVGSMRKDGYIVINTIFGRKYAHRLAWLYTYGVMPEGYIDHINGDPSDNRISNLRLVNHKSNIENQRAASKNNKSGYLGVYKIKRCGMYTATVYSNGQRYRLGRFKTAEEAYEAYINKKREVHKGCTI